ncbi:MAG TPA: exonuclease domain-containing protein [Candidatus Paceibacterota bacterium]|nr:exonuclease domain-containing protein [Candidatus Paceibacterota bacterium]
MHTARTGEGIIEPLRGGTYTFVDVETTGTSARYGQVIEVGMVRVEDGAVTDTYTTLIRPARPLPPVITHITGITDDDLKEAPLFEEVSGRIESLLAGAVFVAHNASFDYSFLKTEFSRLGVRFNAKTLCTVKLSRALYPQEERHNLDALIARHGLAMENRHRAFDDAYALVAFLRAASQDHAPETVAKSIARILGSHTLPATLSPGIVNALPHAPGVYLFYGPEDEVLYIGKSVDIKTRVLSHFSEDRRTGRERALCEAVTHIEYEETSGELSALLRESQLIKELAPLYNRKLRKARRLAVIESATDDRGYRTASSAYREEIADSDLGAIEAVFRTATQGKTLLRTLVKEYELCPRLLGIEQGSGSCFSHQLGRCRGACVGKEDQASYNERFAEAFKERRIRAWPFPGAMLLPEDPAADEGTAYVIDRWKILKVLSYTQDGYDEEPVDADFDYDSYRILAKHLLRKDVREKLVPYRLQGEEHALL